MSHYSLVSIFLRLACSCGEKHSILYKRMPYAWLVESTKSSLFDDDWIGIFSVNVLSRRPHHCFSSGDNGWIMVLIFAIEVVDYFGLLLIRWETISYRNALCHPILRCKHISIEKHPPAGWLGAGTSHQSPRRCAAWRSWGELTTKPKKNPPFFHPHRKFIFKKQKLWQKIDIDLWIIFMHFFYLKNSHYFSQKWWRWESVSGFLSGEIIVNLYCLGWIKSK